MINGNKQLFKCKINNNFYFIKLILAQSSINIDITSNSSLNKENAKYINNYTLSHFQEIDSYFKLFQTINEIYKNILKLLKKKKFFIIQNEDDTLSFILKIKIHDKIHKIKLSLSKYKNPYLFGSQTTSKETYIDSKERALRCECGNVLYPRVVPAVIVGITNGDKILVTKYRTGFAHFALVAGFTEIGETLEETVAREAMEETGLKVKNIRYYKSQPWGIVDDILVGFYCDVDGDDTIKMDEGELKVAEWRSREDIELQPDEYSLTNEMMKMFKDGKI